MHNYHYIVASLPELTSGWKFQDKSADDLTGEIREQCGKDDLALLDILQESFIPDNLTQEFYQKALASSNAFIREYFTFDLKVRNAKVRYLNKELSRPADKDVIALAIPESDQDEDGRIAAAFKGDDLLARERAVDDLYWEKIDSLSLMHWFDMNVIMAFILKLHIIDRWHLLDEQTGREMFKKLVDNLTQTNKNLSI
ncbi:MAG: DUF2764 family protein [Candidatus Cryptobacteroides sp.]